MKVIFTNEMFERTIYEVSVDNGLLTLHSEKDDIKISLHSLRQFSVYGSASNPKQFMLITSGDVYHGVFPTKGDMEQILDVLKDAAGQHIEINLNME